MLIDEFLPTYDARERHRIHVRAPLAAVYAALRQPDLSHGRLSAWLMRMRGMTPSRGRITLDNLLRMRFVLLAERPDEELLIGLVGRFWLPSGGLRTIDAAAFRTFDEPGHARAVWTFALAPGADGTTMLSTETRVQGTDAQARRRFGLYWAFVRPFSGLIRRDILRALKRQAEAAQTPSSGETA